MCKPPKVIEASRPEVPLQRGLRSLLNPPPAFWMFSFLTYSSPMVSAAKRTEYHGSEDALVIALDIGTTFSGASYTILRDGQVPQIASVTQ